MKKKTDTPNEKNFLTQILHCVLHCFIGSGDSDIERERETQCHIDSSSIFFKMFKTSVCLLPVWLGDDHWPRDRLNGLFLLLLHFARAKQQIVSSCFFFVLSNILITTIIKTKCFRYTLGIVLTAKTGTRSNLIDYFF